jgi:hypothetical protein
MDVSQAPLIEFRGVTKVYGSGALAGVDLPFRAASSSPSWGRPAPASRRR